MTEPVESPATQPTQSSPGRPSLLAMLAAAAGLVAVMLLGILVLGRLASSDVMAMVLTTAFFGAVFAALALVVRRRRAWLLPLAVPFAVVALVAGVILGAPLVLDDVVDEDVVTASTPSAAPSSSAGAPPSANPSSPTPTAAPTPVNVAVSRGSFEPLSHPGTGTATLISTVSEGVKLTLTDFETDNGPDVRVYLSRGTDAEGRGESYVDLGGLKGNKGDQQYDVPAGLDVAAFDAVVLWCRAFDVGFTQARLTPAV